MHYGTKITGALLISACAGCATTRHADVVRPAPIALERDTVRLEGWFSAKGEWMVNATKDYQSYNPLGKDENDRCVSVVSDTGAARSKFAALDGKPVVITGFAMPYEELQLGPTEADRLMSRRYFKNEVVFNSCLRERVFVAQSIHMR